MTSKATKRKHVIKEVLDEFVLPEKDQEIVKLVSSCGNNLHQVVNERGEKYIVSMPTKFRRNIWIKRDDYVIVTAIKEGDKVKAEISSILYKEQIKHIQSHNMWPRVFSSGKDMDASQGAVDDDMLPPVHSDSDSSSELFDDGMLSGMGNPNRPRQCGTTEPDHVSTTTDSEEEQ